MSNFLNIIFIIFILNIFKLNISQKIFDSNLNCKIIYINTNIIYIIDSINNTNIYLYNNDNNISEKIGVYYNISTYKRIMNADDNNFIIYGLNNDNNLVFRKYKYSTSLQYQKNEQLNSNLYLNNIEHLNGVYIKNNTFILSAIVNNSFSIYLIDMDKRLYKLNKIDDSKFITDENYMKINIKCDSYDGISFFCIFSYQNPNYWKLFYLRGVFGKTEENYGSICDNYCRFGNIIKINNLDNKYLVCYNKYFNNYLSIFCQYYSYLEGNVQTDSSYEVSKIYGQYVNDKPLILYNYQYSIIILFDYYFLYRYYIGAILCSLDLKINIQSVITYGNYLSIINSFNDDNNFYVFYEETTDYNISTKIIKQQIRQCLQLDSIMLPNLDTKFNINFALDHLNEIITFSLDNNINLYRGENYEIINPNGNNYIALTNKINFLFGKKENYGVFTNYYCYLSLVDFDKIKNYQFLSLICSIKVTICYPSCKICSINKVASPENHMCQLCSNNYYKLQSEIRKEEFNCYSSNDKEISNYYLNNNIFYPCDSSCSTCQDGNSCLTCKDSYYFKYEKIINNIKDICYTGNVESYYLDYNVNEVYNGENIKIAYKQCYQTCSSCIGSGSYENNKCTACKSGNMKYPFDDFQCLSIDTKTCLNSNQYWELDKNNIHCIKDVCKKNIVLYGNNKGQCVDNCQNFKNPYLQKKEEEEVLFTLTNCGGKNYCIPQYYCSNGKFNINNEKQTCERIGECNINIFTDLFEPNLTDLQETEIIQEEHKKVDFNKTNIIIKNINKENYFLSWTDLNMSLINDYINIYENESEKNDDNILIYLITSIIYNNFIITIYPLDIEEYVYYNHLINKNLGFINFTKFFSNNTEYKRNKNNTYYILIMLIENISKNTSIHDLNYFFYSFNFINSGPIFNEIKINENNNLFKDELKQLEVLYPLHYYHSRSITSNINTIYYIYPDVELTNISDPFYNDICLIYTTDDNTDISLNDRRNEYFLNVSLCEYNCNFVKFINKGLNTLRALCNCNIKDKIIFSNISKENEIFPSISVSNTKAIRCIKELFTKYNLLSNINFWIILFIFIFQLIFLVTGYCSIKEEIFKLLNLNNICIITRKRKSNSKELNNNINNNIDNNNLNSPPKKNKSIEDNCNIEDTQKTNGKNKLKPINHINKINDTKKQYINNYKNNNTDTKSFNNANNFNQNRPTIKRKNNIYEKQSINEINNPSNEIPSKIYSNSYEKVIIKNSEKNLSKFFDQNQINNDNEKYSSDYDYKERDNQKKKTKEKLNISLIKNSTNNLIDYSSIVEENNLIDEKLKTSRIAPKEKEKNHSYDNNEKFGISNSNNNDFNIDNIKNSKNKLIILDNEEEDTTNKSNKLNNITNQGKIDKNEDLINKPPSLKKEPDKNILKPIKLIKKQINNNANLYNEINTLKENDSNRPIITNLEKTEKTEDNDDMKDTNINNSIKLDILNDKNYYIRDTEFTIIENKSLNKINCLFFFEYLKKRELCLITFLNKGNTIPYFIRYSIFLLSLSFIFLFNCFLFEESLIHERYLFSLNGGESNNISYYFKKEFVISVYSALIGNIIKMILIKLIMYCIFEINNKNKIVINDSYEEGLNKEKSEDLKTNRNDYIKKYKNNYVIYSICVIIINIIIGYICTCYGGVFPNSYTYFIFGLLFSFIMSIIICIFLCFIIFILYKIGKEKNNFCALSFYISLSNIY